MTKYSVFISFKNTFEGKPTVDAEIAKKLYDMLTQRGIATFYSNDTIKNLGASEYKQVINDALDSSSVLILIGSKLEYIKKDTAQWVHYEWGNFHSECMYSNGSKILVPYLSDTIARKDKPFELREIQTFTLENNSIDEVVEFVLNFLNPQQRQQKENASPVEQVTSVTKPPLGKAEKFLKRAKIGNLVNLSILLFFISACCISLLVLLAMPGTAFATSSPSIIMLSIVACYPFACVLIHYSRKLKILPKAMFGVFITLMCLPIVGIVSMVATNLADWSAVLGLGTAIIAPIIGIILSAIYSIVVLRKTRQATTNQSN